MVEMSGDEEKKRLQFLFNLKQQNIFRFLILIYILDLESKNEVGELL